MRPGSFGRRRWRPSQLQERSNTVPVIYFVTSQVKIMLQLLDLEGLFDPKPIKTDVTFNAKSKAENISKNDIKNVSN